MLWSIGRGGGARLPAARLALGLAAGLAGCGGSQAEADSPEKDHRIRMDTEIVHEPCDPTAGQPEQHDLDADGHPELTLVVVDGKERCRIVDLNFDGKPDAWAYRAKDGSVRRRESDFDRDGRVDEIATYKAGVLVAKHLATSLRGKLDTWHYYADGRLQRTQRDANGDSFIDQWWEYPNPKRLDCPLVHTDVDGDGRPDLGATVDVCASESGNADEVEERSVLEPGKLETVTETQGADSGKPPAEPPTAEPEGPPPPAAAPGGKVPPPPPPPPAAPPAEAKP